MHDITAIYYSAELIPQKFAEKVREQLLSAIGDMPLISLTKTPLDFGTNLIDENPRSSIINVYKALLTGAKAAQTDYIALCEDDTLYPAEHFVAHRPSLDTFAYNFSRWNMHTWSDPPFYSLRQRRILATLIAPRELFIEAMEERFEKYPDTSLLPVQWMGEPARRSHEKKLGVTPRVHEEFKTYHPVIVFSHPDSYGYQFAGTNKKSGKIRAYDIPHWGRAQETMDKYYG